MGCVVNVLWCSNENKCIQKHSQLRSCLHFHLSTWPLLKYIQLIWASMGWEQRIPPPQNSVPGSTWHKWSKRLLLIFCLITKTDFAFDDCITDVNFSGMVIAFFRATTRRKMTNRTTRKKKRKNWLLWKGGKKRTPTDRWWRRDNARWP